MTNNEFSAIRIHNHLKESKYVKSAIFREELIDFVKKTPVSLRDAYDCKMKEDIEACAMISFKSIKSTLKRNRNQTIPYNPKNLKDIRLIGKSEAWRNALNFIIDDNMHTISVDVQEVNSGYLVFLYDIKLLEMMKETVHFSLDATYYSRPNLKDAYQLLTIMGKFNNKFVPCVWVLMTNKTEESYLEVFKFVKKSIMKDFHVQSFMADYELALQNAVHIVYPYCTIKGCFFHYVHNVRKYAKMLCIFKALKNTKIETRIKGVILLRKILNLPLLPSFSMKLGYAIIKDSFNANEDLAAIHLLKKLFKYVENFWLNKVDTNVLSVFKTEVRTNNNQERYHRSLNNLMKQRPKFYKFILKLQDLITRSIVEISQLKNNLNIKNSNRRRSDINFDKWLEKGQINLEKLELLDDDIKRHKVDEFLYTSVFKNERVLKEIKGIIKNKGKKTIKLFI
ncbi:uncharacterized protein [Prorops nasuta]|uniref:uncharacterized protein n=1 Tax=Prorops nasuta TaxID=863751 RepID=UPI0034CD7E02